MSSKEHNALKAMGEAGSLGAARAQLSRGMLADAAISMIEAHGIDKLTMRALAADIGSGTMTLYTHVRNRDDLLAAVVERLIVELDIAGRVAGGGSDVSGEVHWQGIIAAAMREYRLLAERFPRSFELLALAPYGEGSVAPHLAQTSRMLEAAGLSPADARWSLSTADAFATGFLVVWARTLISRSAGAGAGSGSHVSQFEELEVLRSLEAFDLGVEAMILGLEAKLALRS